VGATASGKSELAHHVALSYDNVEILCVDSMTVYRGMDIGTAKPSPRERAEVRYHLLDLVDASEPYTVAEFQRTARAVLDDIAARGARALLVGGTGLYSRAVIDNFDIPGEYVEIRERLQREADDDLTALYERLANLDPDAAAKMEPTNERRVVRALEVIEGSGRLFSSFGSPLTSYFASPVPQIGLMPSLEELDRRIEERLRQWVDEGLLDEVRRLVHLPGGWSLTAAQAVGYKEFVPAVCGDATLEECFQAAATSTRQLVRRQVRWFRRDPRIDWHDTIEGARDAIARWWGPASRSVGN
jgi:tRNA dimethylallyltransferase